MVVFRPNWLVCAFAARRLAQTSDRPALMPSERVLALHMLNRSYESFDKFQPELPDLLQQGGLLHDCIQLTQKLGILEPLSGEHVPPEAMLIQGPNWRESLICNGLLSRNRAMLWLLEQHYGSFEELRGKDVYLAEALTGFAQWLRRNVSPDRLICSEFLDGAEQGLSEIQHQDLCSLSFDDESFDLVLCNELFEHVQNIDRAFSHISRVLRPGGRLLATCPLAFGQDETIVKALADPQTGETQLLAEAELHGDPIRPKSGSLVYRIPGWEVLSQLRQAGFAKARIQHIASWKHGILGSDLPGVLVIEAER